MGVVTINILASRPQSRETHQLVERLVSSLLEEQEGSAEERDQRQEKMTNRNMSFCQLFDCCCDAISIPRIMLAQGRQISPCCFLRMRNGT